LRSARSFIDTTSEPAPGSDIASAPTCSPEISLGRYFLLLRLAAVAADLVDAEVRMGAVGQADRGRGARDFLHRDDVREVAHPGAAIFLVGGHAEQAHVTELLPQVGGEEVVAVDLRRARQISFCAKADGIAQHVDVLAEVKVESEHSGLRVGPPQGEACAPLGGSLPSREAEY
jgi:hypothetical protein